MKITAIITSRDPQNKSKLQTDIDELINSVFSPMVEDERVILAPNSVRIKQKQWVDVSYKTIRLDKIKRPCTPIKVSQGLIWFSLNSLSRQANFFCPQENKVFWF